jgi:alcohol dehydrogenase
MKAVLVKIPGNIDTCNIENVEFRREKGILIKTKYAGLNPIDINIISKPTNFKIIPIPHIPGAEFVGEVDDPENSLKFKKGDRVIIYNRLFDGTCNHCLRGESLFKWFDY